MNAIFITKMSSPKLELTPVIVGECESERSSQYEQAEHFELDEKDDRKLLMKTDLMLLPFFHSLVFSIQYMDKATSSYASIMGIMEDLNMDGDQYSWSGTTFYIGYLFFEFQASYLLQKFPIAKTTAFFIPVWGVFVCLHPVANYAGFLTLKTLLGCAESAMSPSMIMLTSQWWKKEEQFFRMTLWIAACGIGDTLASLIAYGLYVHGVGNWSVAPWKILYVICGLTTILFSVAFFHIPDSPSSAWFLSEVERVQVVDRVRDNKQSLGEKEFKKYQFLEAILDYKTWILFFFGGKHDSQWRIRGF